MTGASRRGRVLYLTQWFDPEPVMKGEGFVRGLIAEGYDVQVCTGFPNYPTGRLYPGYAMKLFQRDVHDGVQVDRVPLYPSHDASSLRRALNYLSFFASALIYGLMRARRFDVVYVYHPPITVGLAAALLGWVTRTPFILDIQDLWPDSVAVSGMSSSGRLAAVLDPVCRFVYRRAHRIVAQSAGIAARLSERGVPPSKIATLYNWADEDVLAPRPEKDLERYGFEGNFNFVFAGNLGAVQGLPTLIRAAVAAAEEDPRIRLHLIGDGLDAGRLRDLCRSIGGNVVRMHPPEAKAEIATVLARAQVLVAHLNREPLFALTIPSKIQSYLALGKPLLVAIEGECATLVETAGAGLSAVPEDALSVAAAMLKLAALSLDELERIGERSAALYAERFSFASAIQATAGVIESAIER